jgi:hypothetical protein
MININKLKKFLSAFCILLMLAPMVLAAEEEDDSDGSGSNNSEKLGLSDFWKPAEAKKTLDDSAFKTPVDKGTNWGTLGLIIIIVFYFGKCLWNIMAGDDEARSKGFIGLFIGVGAIVLFLAVTSTALDALNWQY